MPSNFRSGMRKVSGGLKEAFSLSKKSKVCVLLCSMLVYSKLTMRRRARPKAPPRSVSADTRAQTSLRSPSPM